MLAKKKDPGSSIQFSSFITLLEKKKRYSRRHPSSQNRKPDIHVVSPPLPSYYHFQISGLFASF